MNRIRVLHKIVKQIKFMFCQGNLSIVKLHFSFARFDGQTTMYNFLTELACPSQYSFYMGYEFVRFEGFCDIVISAHLQAFYLIADAGFRREHAKRYFTAFLCPPPSKKLFTAHF